MHCLVKSIVVGTALISLTLIQGPTARAEMGVAQAAQPDAQMDAQAEQHKPAPISGTVTETMNGGGYSYICLESQGKKVWVAVPQMKVKVGDDMAFYPGSVMPNFKSDSLNRTFDAIVFSPGPLVLPGTKADKAGKGKAAEGGSAAKIKVEKASGANAYTVAELFGKGAKLDGAKVVVSGKVVKVSSGIMGKNWLHLEDGTGEAAKGTNHLVVTTDDTAEVGAVVTVSGTLAKDKDFGYGYKYDVILEDAVVKK